MKLAIEAIDLLHRGQIEGFCIAFSDSDFTTLASRIREDGVSVYAFGEQKASTAYVRSCDRFFYCDLLITRQGARAKPSNMQTRRMTSCRMMTLGGRRLSRRVGRYSTRDLVDAQRGQEASSLVEA